MSMRFLRGEPVTVQDPPFAQAMFAQTGGIWPVIWLVLRVWLGWQWLTSGFGGPAITDKGLVWNWGKIGQAAWMNDGSALKGFWERAVATPAPGQRPVITYEWYDNFLTFMLNNGWYTWFAKLITFGEILIGIALILGAFVGIAAFFGMFLNVNFLLAGTASTNPVMMLAAILLILAWKTAGYYGLDRYLLRWLGTPWGRTAKPQISGQLPTTGPMQA